MWSLRSQDSNLMKSTLSPLVLRYCPNWIMPLILIPLARIPLMLLTSSATDRASQWRCRWSGAPLLNLDESSVQETIVHQYSSGRNGIEILHHLGYLLFLKTVIGSSSSLAPKLSERNWAKRLRCKKSILLLYFRGVGDHLILQVHKLSKS